MSPVFITFNLLERDVISFLEGIGELNSARQRGDHPLDGEVESSKPSGWRTSSRELVCLSQPRWPALEIGEAPDLFSSANMKQHHVTCTSYL